MLEDLGFLVEVLPDPEALGTVISQEPEFEIYLDYGSTVIIEVEEADPPEEEGNGEGTGDGDGDGTG